MLETAAEPIHRPGSKHVDTVINLPDVKVEDAGISYKDIHEARAIRDAESAMRGQAGGETGANSPRQQLMTITPTNPRC